MSKLNKKTFFIILLSSSLVSCSTFDSLRFWQNDDDVDPDEPKVYWLFQMLKGM